MGYQDPINGVPELDRPVVDVHGGMSAWELTSKINRALKQCGFSQAALEFRRLAEECENDEGMLFTLALLFIRVPGQEVS